MSIYSSVISQVQGDLAVKNRKKARLQVVGNQIIEINESIRVLQDVQKVLSTISDDNLTTTLDHVTDVINKALSQIFQNDIRRVSLRKELYGGKNSHIVLELVNGQGQTRDIVLQSGTGLRQTVSFLYTLAMIEISGGRKLVVMDEILSGVHPKAKAILIDLMKIFEEEGFQFIVVEYGVLNLGTRYEVENNGTFSKLVKMPEAPLTIGTGSDDVGDEFGN